MADTLVSVSEYIKMRGIKTPQVVNAWVRQQGAPAIMKEGKRMIPVEQMDAWVKDRELEKAEGKGTTKRESIQRRTQAKQGALLAHNTRSGVVITEIKRITDFRAIGDTTKGTDFDATWEGLARAIRRGDLAVINPHIVYDLLIAHYDHMLYEGKLEEEQYDEIVGAIKICKQLADPSAGDDLVELGDEGTDEDEETEANSDEEE